MAHGAGNNGKTQHERRRSAQSLAREAWHLADPGDPRGLRFEGYAFDCQAVQDPPFEPRGRRSRADAPQRAVNARIVCGVVDRFAVHR
jgi:hypothetical protein